MDGLQAQLQPDGFYPVEAGAEIQDVLRQAVGAGGDGEDLHLRVADGGGEQGFQIVHRRVGVGVGLEVGDIGAGVLAHLPGDAGNGLLDLGVDGRLEGVRGAGRGSGGGKLPGATLAAEDTSPGAKSAVPVGAGHAAV